jgi:hypothetical protein
MDRNNDGIRDYIGVILLDIDLMNRGRYKVHINELHAHLPVSQGIWCRNRVHNWAYNTDFALGSCGSYYPVQAGTRVLVQFKDEDFEHGEIVKIISDQETFRLPLYCTPEARDLITTIYRTPIYSNIFHINEFGLVPSMTGQPDNSIHQYFNCDVLAGPFGGQNDPDTGPETKIRTTYIINEDGVHFYTTDNIAVTIDKDGYIAVNKNILIKVGENADIHIKGDAKVHVDGQTDLYSDGEINIKSDGNINIQATSDINLNCGTSAAKAEDNNGYNTFPPHDKELKGITRLGDVALAAGKMVT